MSITYLRNKKAEHQDHHPEECPGQHLGYQECRPRCARWQLPPITESQKNQLNIKYGVEVMKVNSGALKDGGISRGFIIQRINDNNINTIDDLQKAVKECFYQQGSSALHPGCMANRQEGLLRCSAAERLRVRAFKKNVS